MQEKEFLDLYYNDGWLLHNNVYVITSGLNLSGLNLKSLLRVSKD